MNAKIFSFFFNSLQKAVKNQPLLIWRKKEALPSKSLFILTTY